MTVRTGACHCGAVGFEISGEVRGVVYCHCTQCRKQTGHFVAATRCDDSQLTVKGADNLTWYEASDEARRGFCSTCGSHMFWKRHGSDQTSVWAGAFEKPSGLEASHHIYVDEKGDYYELCDGLPQFEGRD